MKQKQDIKYKTIYQTIKDKIISEEYKENQQIPDELTLCKEFDCSRMTIKKALDLLVDEGLMYRKRGQGSFIMSKGNLSNRIDVPERELQGFTKSANGKTTSKILTFQLEFATEKIAQNLNISINDPVYHIVRVRMVNDKPYVIEKTYMSTNIIPGINLEILNGSIYNYIEKKLGYKIASAQKTTRAAISNELDHKELGLKDYEPVLEIEQIAYLDNGTPFEYSISRHRYDLFEFTSFSLRR